MNEDFKYMAAIAEHGSISGAARSEHISQPGLSQRLKRLEAQIGVPLFERKGFPLLPTAAGEVYLRYAHRALAAEESMMREMAGAVSGRLAMLRIGISIPRANALLAKALVSFYESHRGCTVELREMETLNQLHDLFMSDSIDCAMLTPIVCDPALYIGEVLCHERLMVAVPARSKLPQLDGVSKGERLWLRKLEGLPFVLPSCGHYFDPLVRKAVEMSGVQLDIVVRGCSPQLALDIVEDGLGASIVPSTSLTDRKGVRAHELADVPTGNPLRYIRRRDCKASDEELLFLEVLKGCLEKPSQASRGPSCAH